MPAPGDRGNATGYMIGLGHRRMAGNRHRRRGFSCVGGIPGARPPGGQDCLVDAGMHAEDAGHAGQGKDAPHLLAGRGEQHFTTGLPGLRPHPDQHAQTAAVDELQCGKSSIWS